MQQILKSCKSWASLLSAYTKTFHQVHRTTSQVSLCWMVICRRHQSGWWELLVFTWEKKHSRTSIIEALWMVNLVEASVQPFVNHQFFLMLIICVFVSVAIFWLPSNKSNEFYIRRQLFVWIWIDTNCLGILSWLKTPKNIFPFVIAVLFANFINE